METATPGFFEAFKENPVWILLAVFVAAVGTLVALAGWRLLAKNPKVAFYLGWIALGAGVVTELSGAMGMMRRQQMDEEVLSTPGLSASDKARARAYGDAVGTKNVVAGFLASAPPTILGVLLVVAYQAKNRKKRERG